MSEIEYLRKPPQKYMFDSCKLLWHRKRVKDFLDGKKIMPLHIDMGIHKACNIRCIYCYGIKQHPSPEFIPEDRLLLFAKDAKGLGIKSIAIIGDGEPTMNKGLYAFVQRLKELRVDCSVATNGLLLDREKINTLTSSCVWLRFNVSGVDKYDYIMGARPGSFDKITEIVKYTVRNKRDCTVGLQMVLIPDCFDQVIPLAEKALKWGVDYLVIKQFSDPGEAIPISFDMDEYDKAVDVLKAAEAMTTENTKIIIKWEALNATRNITKYKKWDFGRCLDLPFIFQISGNGDCYPCGYLFGNDKFCYGNINRNRLSTILLSHKYWDIIANVAATPLDKLCKGQCRHCETNKFIDRVKKIYKGNLQEALIELCGSKEQYQKLMDNPPTHIRFI